MPKWRAWILWRATKIVEEWGDVTRDVFYMYRSDSSSYKELEGGEVRDQLRWVKKKIQAKIMIASIRTVAKTETILETL